MHKTTSCLLLALAAIVSQSAQAQTFTVLHQFTGGKDGAQPQAGLTIGSTGKFYGTTSNASGNAKGFGTVFRLSHSGSKWTLNTLHSFNGGFDGAYPEARVVIGPHAGLYGTTYQGGGNSFCSGTGCGTVFEMQHLKQGWRKRILYRFTGGASGAIPANGDLVFDAKGNIYGATVLGGSQNLGTVYSLARTSRWAETVLHSFIGSDGANPLGGVVFDNAGNVYGTTVSGGGGGNGGVVFQLMPSGSNWTYNTLYEFCAQRGDGCNPSASLIFDQSGNLYGSASNGCTEGQGSVFELASGKWIETVLYLFTGGSGGANPEGALTMDAAGDLYGTAAQGGAYGNGAVFKLTNSGGSWTYTSLHDFTGGRDGAGPVGNVIFDGKGNLYGAASAGGKYGFGVVFEITP